MILDCAGKPLDLSRPVVMGVLNVTPDSFSDGGRFVGREAAVEHALCMVEEGAAILDIGGESTRPGAPEVPVEEELARVIPVLEALCPYLSVPVSIDTRKPEVMEAAVAAGAGLINDVNALRAPGALAAAVAAGVPVCLMHMQGEPRTMQQAPEYGDVVEEVRDFLLARAGACEAAGIPSHRILFDPGFGFGKALGHNLRLLRELGRLTATGYPVLVGLSRKSMIGKVLGLETGERLHPSLALAVLAVWQGARIVRAHDVRATVEAIGMCAAVLNAETGDWE
ncbi:MAG TPA: dihydropteroate synthase [Gammaproteobacteria bacterium]|nr:dihydropteroate synthase [Gammaproteobacteria bacterium]